MKSPQTINGLMRHLRNECNVNISGSRQKQQLISYGLRNVIDEEDIDTEGLLTKYFYDFLNR